MRVEQFIVTDWENEETGLLIDENEEWILVRHIPVDYMVDGYKLYRKEFVEERLHSEDEEAIEKVLRLKGIKAEPPAGFTFRDVIGTLQWVQEQYGLFEFQDEEETESVFGRIHQAGYDTLVIDMILADGTEEPTRDYEFYTDEIRVITFDTDYFRSIRLLWLDQQQPSA